MNERVLEALNPRTVLFYARDLGTLGEQLDRAWQVATELFPVQLVDGLTYEYWIGEQKRTIMATLSAYDTEASIASRQAPGPRYTGDMPKISRKIRLGEKERILQERIRANAALPTEVREFVDRQYDDITLMRNAVLARIVKFIMDAVTTMGSISISENGVILTVNFNIPAANRETLATPWSDNTANPYDDEKRWIETMEDTYGFTPTRALTSSKVVRNMLKNDKVRELVLGRNFSGQQQRQPTLEEFNQWRQAVGLPRIATLDSRVESEGNDGTLTTTRLFPEDKYVLLPPEPLGNLLMGPTVEALDQVANGTINFSEARGIWAGQYKEIDPPTTWTKAAAIAFPTFPGADRIFLADVL